MAKSDLRHFDYRRVAELDSAMWHSYYNHKFLKLFFQLLQVMRTQLHLNWLLTLRLAWHSGIAAKNYRLKRGDEDYEGALKSLTNFYRIISDHCTEPFNFKEAARLELEWWDIHRYPKKHKKSLEQSLAEAQSAIYNEDSKKFKEYAHYRAVAMMLPNHEGDKQPNPPDYREITELLVKSWKALHQAVG